MRPGGVASRVACAAATRPPPRALGAALPGRLRTLPIDPGSTCTKANCRRGSVVLIALRCAGAMSANSGGEYTPSRCPAQRRRCPQDVLGLSVPVLPVSIGSVLRRPGKAAPSARGGALVCAAQATREATQPGRLRASPATRANRSRRGGFSSSGAGGPRGGRPRRRERGGPAPRSAVRRPCARRV